MSTFLISCNQVKILERLGGRGKRMGEKDETVSNEVLVLMTGPRKEWVIEITQETQ